MKTIREAIEKHIFFRFKETDDIFLPDIREELRRHNSELPNSMLLTAVNTLAENGLLAVVLTKAGFIIRISEKGRSLLKREEGGPANE